MTSGPEAPAPPILAGAGRVDITPGAPVPLFGYQGRTAPFADVADPLEANALVVRQNTGQGVQRVALIALDTLFAGDLETRVHAALGAPEDLRIVICASHTHYAPCLDEGKPTIGRPDPAHRDGVVAALAGLVRDLLGQPGAPIALAMGAEQDSPEPLAINRRDRRWGLTRRWPFVTRRMMIAPNRAAPGRFPIRVVPVTAGGRTLAVLWHWTCHPVSAPRRDRVSASYPGAVRAALRAHLGQPDLPVIFLQGFAGDVRPTVGIRAPGLRQRLAAFPGPVFAAPDDAGHTAWLEAISRTVLAAHAACPTPEPPEGRLAYRETHVPLADLMPGTTAQTPLSLATLEIGQTLSIALISAEIVNGYRAIAARALGPETICTGYRGDCFGYLPLDSQLPEGGYEVDGFLAAFSLDRGFAPGLDAIIAERLGGLGAQPAPGTE